MKLGTKIFCCVTLFFSAAFLWGGYMLLAYFGDTVIEREAENALREYQYNKFVVESAFLTKGEEWFRGAAAGEYDLGRIAADMSRTVAFYEAGGTALYSEFPEGTQIEAMLPVAEKDKVKYKCAEIGGRRYILATGLLTGKDACIYMVTGIDIEELLRQQERMIRRFGTVYAGTVVIGMLLIFGLSLLLTSPLKRLRAATKSIAQGNYKESIRISGRDEVGELAGDFRRMQEAVEEKVQELTRSAEEKEDFAANFAHELKTPLTSIIGYADRILRKELSREEQKKAARYIRNEGLRLEALSHKLMDLTNLNRGDFPLQEMRADRMLQELSQDVAFLMEERGADMRVEAEEAVIRVEYDLCKTLFLNLADNALKAGADRISVTGTVRGGMYRVEMEDNGGGIPAEELQRITEAFYMVDKSRSRKQHGAGLGLALAERIAKIHGGGLQFESEVGRGTKVSWELECVGGTRNAER